MVLLDTILKKKCVLFLHLFAPFTRVCTFQKSLHLLQEFAPFPERVHFFKKVQTLEPLVPLIPLMPLEKGVQVVKKVHVVLLMLD